MNQRTQKRNLKTLKKIETTVNIQWDFIKDKKAILNIITKSKGDKRNIRRFKTIRN